MFLKISYVRLIFYWPCIYFKRLRVILYIKKTHKNIGNTLYFIYKHFVEYPCMYDIYLDFFRVIMISIKTNINWCQNVLQFSSFRIENKLNIELHIFLLSLSLLSLCIMCKIHILLSVYVRFHDFFIVSFCEVRRMLISN